MYLSIYYFGYCYFIYVLSFIERKMIKWNEKFIFGIFLILFRVIVVIGEKVDVLNVVFMRV